MTPRELALAIDPGCSVDDALPFIAKYRESVTRECAKAMGDSGDYYSSRAELWLVDHFKISRYRFSRQREAK